MDELGPYVLPLVGGYLFARTWYGSKYLVFREDGHKLYFRSAAYGTGLFLAILAAWLLVREAIFIVGELIDSQGWPTGFAPSKLVFDTSDIWFVAIASVYGGWFFGWLCNQFSDQELCYLEAIHEDQDDFAKLVARSNDRELPICITMDDNRVYLGWIAFGYQAREVNASFSLLPLASGYRDRHGEIVFVTDYLTIYSEIEEAGTDTPAESTKVQIAVEAAPSEPALILGRLEPDDFLKVLPIARMKSAFLFDVKAFVTFQENKEQQQRRKKRKSKKAKSAS